MTKSWQFLVDSMTGERIPAIQNFENLVCGKKEESMPQLDFFVAGTGLQ